MQLRMSSGGVGRRRRPSRRGPGAGARCRPEHAADAYRDALGESGRAKNTELFRDAVELDVTNHFAFSPKMSHVPKAWVDADPTFWTPAPPAPVAKKPGEKK